jgi:KUP system potassium uptake protein
VIVVTVLFQSSSRLAAAYGISVTAAMVIDSFLAFFVIWRCWNWPLWKAAGLIVPLVLIEQTFFAANFLKLFDGGWVPLALASLIMLSMLTWQKGSRALAKATRRDEQELAWFARKIESQIEKKRVHRAPGTAIFLTGDPQSAPTSLMHNLKHNKVIHERNIILSIQTLEQPRVARHDRIHVEEIEHGFWRVIARYGFMESPSVPKIIEQCKRKNLNIDIGGTSFFLSRRSLRPTDKSEMPWWQEWIFIWMAGNAADATEFFRIPHDRVVEVGTQVLV